MNRRVPVGTHGGVRGRLPIYGSLLLDEYDDLELDGPVEKKREKDYTIHIRKKERMIKMKIMKNITVVLLGVLLLTMLSGCGGSETEPINNVAFVLGIADDETKVNDGISELEALPTLAGSTYAFISAEGQPTTIGQPGEIPDFSQKGYTKDMMNRVYAGIKADLTERLETYQPSTAEIDMAAATELAVRNLNAHAIEGRRNVLVYYCSGRSTTGLINMTETGLDDLDIEASVAAIAKQMDADMSKIDEVIWYCLGDYCGPKQGSLSAEEKVTMKTFYEELFHALGASTVTFRDDLPSTEAYSFSDTPVSAIPVKDTVSGLSAEPIVLSESKLEFLADSAEFKDTDAAEAALQPVADMLLKEHDLRVLLYSTCAGDIDYPELSSKRSETVKNCLIAKGVEGRRIVVVNVKIANDPYYKLGLGTGPEASVNRKTVIADVSSEFGRQLLLAQQ